MKRVKGLGLGTLIAAESMLTGCYSLPQTRFEPETLLPQTVRITLGPYEDGAARRSLDDSLTGEPIQECAYLTLDLDHDSIPDIVAIGSFIATPSLEERFKEADAAREARGEKRDYNDVFRKGVPEIEVWYASQEVKNKAETSMRNEIQQHLALPANAHIMSPTQRAAMKEVNIYTLLPYEHFAKAPKGYLLPMLPQNYERFWKKKAELDKNVE